jgi:hypothetical protein
MHIHFDTIVQYLELSRETFMFKFKDIRPKSEK